MKIQILRGYNVKVIIFYDVLNISILHAFICPYRYDAFNFVVTNWRLAILVGLIQPLFTPMVCTSCSSQNLSHHWFVVIILDCWNINADAIHVYIYIYIYFHPQKEDLMDKYKFGDKNMKTLSWNRWK